MALEICENRSIVCLLSPIIPPAETAQGVYLHGLWHRLVLVLNSATNGTSVWIVHFPVGGGTQTVKSLFYYWTEIFQLETYTLLLYVETNAERRSIRSCHNELWLKKDSWHLHEKAARSWEPKTVAANFKCSKLATAIKFCQRLSLTFWREISLHLLRKETDYRNWGTSTFFRTVFDNSKTII